MASKSPAASSPLPSSSHRPASRPFPSPDSPFVPQRRHRKMLKDGSSEVWPEQAELVFMRGLREYWASPWATLNQGRSRWRNQYLVDYLHKGGITRTKKQVASHIQVLRNMLKGHPEHPDFRLVAIPEDLVDSPPPTKSSFSKRPASSSRRGASPNKAYDSSSSASSSPAPSTPGSATHGHVTASRPQGLLPANALLCSPCSPTGLSASTTSHPPESTSVGPQSMRRSSMEIKAEPSTTYPLQPTYGAHVQAPQLIPVSAVAPPSSAWSPWPSQSHNRPMSSGPLPASAQPIPSLSSISLWAGGMVPLNSQFDTTDSSLCISLHIKLSMPPPPAPGTPPSLCDSHVSQASSASSSSASSSALPDGFHGAITLNAPWSRSAECVTRVYSTTSGPAYISEERGFLTRIDTTSLEQYRGFGAFLPASWLTRCKSLETGSTIMQYIYVDGVLVATFKYELERYVGAQHSAMITERYQWVIDTPATGASPAHGLPSIPSPPPSHPHANANAHVHTPAVIMPSMPSPLPMISPTSPSSRMHFDFTSFRPVDTIPDLGFDFSSSLLSRSLVPTTW